MCTYPSTIVAAATTSAFAQTAATTGTNEFSLSVVFHECVPYSVFIYVNNMYTLCIHNENA